jgi:hypothetical protein
VQPLAALLGIVMGSSVALLAGLAMTLAVFLLLPEYQDRLAGEYQPLLKAVAWAALLAGASVLAFVGQIKAKPWRRAAQAGLVVVVALAVWIYRPG